MHHPMIRGEGKADILQNTRSVLQSELTICRSKLLTSPQLILWHDRTTDRRVDRPKFTREGDFEALTRKLPS